MYLIKLWKLSQYALNERAFIVLSHYGVQEMDCFLAVLSVQVISL